MTETYYQVGKLVNTHGIRGDVRVISSTDFPDQRYQPGSRLTLFDKGQAVEEVEVDKHYVHKNFHILHFKGYPSINDVERFKGMVLMVAGEDREDDLEEGAFYYEDIIGLEVRTTEGERLGRVREITALGPNDVWHVQRFAKGADILLPYIEDVVKEVNLDEGYVLIDPMEGLID
ncbi:ribosome maturation factor RimM [Aerococcus sp. UMB1112A]|uniref:ribosome maturation factor RimM n=1 Tax=Aerococcus sp. UMB1112A TaxID=3050609 RepID=UPI0025502B4D|nr:ribosome maturation factor RimM [Aerococcus sp. UMB1112A]MDK8502219.1 ribosome maturation factor RimM [Aerococcus sp. UMB1112A]